MLRLFFDDCAPLCFRLGVHPLAMIEQRQLMPGQIAGVTDLNATERRKLNRRERRGHRGKRRIFCTMFSARYGVLRAFSALSAFSAVNSFFFPYQSLKTSDGAIHVAGACQQLAFAEEQLRVGGIARSAGAASGQSEIDLSEPLVS